MPTVHRERGFAFRIYLDDHLPAHVHVVRTGGVAIIALPMGEAPARVLRFHDLAERDVREARDLVDANRAELWRAWRMYHGR